MFNVFYFICLTMRILKNWFKVSIGALLAINLSLSLCAAWVPSSTGLIAALPGGNPVKDPEALLRLALPVDNRPIRDVQADLEDISTQLRGKQWGKINGDISKAAKTINNHKSQLLESVPQEQRAKAQALIEEIQADLTPLKEAAEAKDIEKVSQAKSEVLSHVGELETSMIKRFPFEVPAEYNNLPQLKGRATVILETNKGPIILAVDGYSAPVTAGNFVDLVERGFYDGLEFTRAEEFYVVQAGDPPGPEDGFVEPGTGQSRTIPLEILVKGDDKPTYGITLEDAGRYRGQPVLPFSAYGTLAMARPETDPNGGSSQFFFLLFEPSLTPAGKNLLDGRYSVFGYVVEGREVLGELKQGDKIKSARVIQGIENLVQPQVA